MTPRVLFVDHESRLSGGELDLVDLVRGVQELADGGFDLHAALPGDGELADALRQHGVHVHGVAMAARLRTTSRWELHRNPMAAVARIPAAAAATWNLVALGRRLRPAVVHTNSLKAHVLGLPAGRAVGAAVVWHVRDIVDEGWLETALRWSAARGPDRVVAISTAVAAPFHRGRLAKKVKVVHNGVRPTPPPEGEVAAARSALGAQPGDVLVGIVGQIAHWKGQDVFIEAARRLAPRHPRVKFVVVGECLFPESERRFADECRQRLEPLVRDGRAVWFGPARPVEPVMAGLDVLVHASRRPEPFGRVIVEAMALGVSVVASTCGAGPELVGDSGGILVQPGDPSGLVDALDALLTDEQRRERLVTAGRARAGHFDITATARGVLEVWAEVGARPAGSSDGATCGARR